MDHYLKTLATEYGLLGMFCGLLLLLCIWLGRRLLQTMDQRVEDARLIPDLLRTARDESNAMTELLRRSVEGQTEMRDALKRIEQTSLRRD